MACCIRLALFFALTGAGCSGSFGKGVRDYDHGRYPEAIEELRSLECDAAIWQPRARARYALYRGLTHFALGDRRATLRWLSEAKRAAEDRPSIFSDEDTGRLLSAWTHLPAE